MSVFIATVILHSISLFLCLPFAYVQCRLRNITLLALIAPVILLHLLILVGFSVWGTHITGPVWVCVLRKAVYVYAAQGVFLMTAVVIVRLWLGTYGYLPADKKRLVRLEVAASLGGLILPLVPALIASLPQVITQTYQSDLLRLNKCSAGYIQSWQVLASGAAFSMPAALVSLLALGAICWRLGFLIRYRASLLSLPDAQQALRDVACTMVRVLLFCITIGVTELYYIVADFLVAFQAANTALGQSTRERHGNHFGHVMLSLWGLLIFLIFSTSQQSLWMLRNAFVCGASRQRTRTHESKGMPYNETDPSLSASARYSREGHQLPFTHTDSLLSQQPQSSSAPGQVQCVPNSPSSTGSSRMSPDNLPVQRSYLTTHGLPTKSRCVQELERDRAFTTRTGQSSWSSPDVPLPRRPVAGEMRTVAPPLPALLRQQRRPTQTAHNHPDTDVLRALSLRAPREHIAHARQSIVRSDTVHVPYSRPDISDMSMSGGDASRPKVIANFTMNGEAAAAAAASSSATSAPVLPDITNDDSTATNSSEQRRLRQMLDELSSSSGSYVDIVLRTQPTASQSDHS